MKFKLSYQNSNSMGLFSPYIYKNKKGKKFWLHMKKRGKGTLYFFSSKPEGALNGLPKGFTVVENEKTGMPFLKKKEGGILGSLFGKKKPKEGEKTEESKTEGTETPEKETEAPKEEGTESV